MKHAWGSALGYHTRELQGQSQLCKAGVWWCSGSGAAVRPMSSKGLGTLEELVQLWFHTLWAEQSHRASGQHVSVIQQDFIGNSCFDSRWLKVIALYSWNKARATQDLVKTKRYKMNKQKQAKEHRNPQGLRLCIDRLDLALMDLEAGKFFLGGKGGRWKLVFPMSNFAASLPTGAAQCPHKSCSSSVLLVQVSFLTSVRKTSRRLSVSVSYWFATLPRREHTAVAQPSAMTMNISGRPEILPTSWGISGTFFVSLLKMAHFLFHYIASQ